MHRTKKRKKPSECSFLSFQLVRYFTYVRGCSFPTRRSVREIIRSRQSGQTVNSHKKLIYTCKAAVIMQTENEFSTLFIAVDILKAFPEILVRVLKRSLLEEVSFTW